jgi:hypothetical protein
MALSHFRRQKEIIWRKLCEEIDADFVKGKGFRQHDAIRAYHENWTIVIDTYRRPKKPVVTHIRAPYVNRDAFEFRIYRRKAGSNILKAFGMQDVVVGFKQFDDDFIIQGNDERKLKALFHNDLIRRLISWQPHIQLWNEVDDSFSYDDWGQGVSELRFEVVGVIMDLQRLRDLYDLFAELLNHLCHIGSAYEDDPLLK